jgi:hypothetical protein
LRGDPGGTLEQAFLALYGPTQQLQARFVLLCAAKNASQAVWQKVAEFLEGKELLGSVEGSRFFVSCACLAAAAVRSGEQAIGPILRHRLLPVMVGVVTAAPFTVAVALAVLLLFEALVEWRDRVFIDREAVGAFFDFAEFLQRELAGGPTVPALHRAVLDAGLTIITARLALHIPVHDHVSRKLDSTAALSERRVAADFQSPAIRYFTVGARLLVSVIEEADGSGPLVIIARGAFGKAIWRLQDSFAGDAAPPELVDVSRVDLPRPGKLVLRPIAVGIEAPAHTSDADITAADDDIRGSTGSEFAHWLDWPAFGVRTSFAERAPKSRPRAVDVLTTLGILDCANRRAVRVQKTPPAEQVIAELDALDSSPVCLIPVTLLLSGDSDASATPRTTAQLQQFLRDIGEPMEITDPERHGLPKLTKAPPVVTAGRVFAAIVPPALGESEDDVRAIAARAADSLVHIIFNETWLEYIPVKASGAQFVLVVRPVGRGHYHVRQIDVITGVPSPFAGEQTLSAQTLAFNIGLVVEFAAHMRPPEAVHNDVERRVKLIGQLCTWPAAPTLVGSASAEFLSADE